MIKASPTISQSAFDLLKGHKNQSKPALMDNARMHKPSVICDSRAQGCLPATNLLNAIAKVRRLIKEMEIGDLRVFFFQFHDLFIAYRQTAVRWKRSLRGYPEFRAAWTVSQPADTAGHSTGLKLHNPPLRRRGHVTTYVQQFV